LCGNAEKENESTWFQFMKKKNKIYGERYVGFCALVSLFLVFSLIAREYILFVAQLS